MSVPPYARGYEGFRGRVGRTAAESEPWWPDVPRPRAGAPNIVVVLADDLGYSDIGPFGAEVPTPTLDRLAARGYRFSNYHTTPVCSPARAALLTGVNPHRAGFANVANFDPGFPGLTLELGDDVVTLPEALREAGYATFMAGKWHLTRDAQMSDAGRRGSWPVQRGFDRYYGTLEGLNSFFAPNRLVRDNSPVEVDRYPDDYYLTDDLTDEAIGMIRSLRASDDRPFFLYFAHHAMHGPLGAPAEAIARQRGRYDGGWDELRDERFARQLASGLFPAGTRLAPRNAEPGLDVPAWSSLPAAERSLLARYMEVYAAMVENIDQNLGRLLAAIEEYGELDNTIVVFTSDNGGTAEGGPAGTRSYFSQFVHVAGLPSSWSRDTPLDPSLIGGPQAMVHYPRGWGMASNTPFRLYKGNTFAGGVRVPFVLSWPAGLPRGDGDSGLRPQYQYVTDLYPTLLELAGVSRPAARQGVPVLDLDGTSFAPVAQSEQVPSTHPEQYAEWGGQRGYYRDGWKLLTLHAPGTPYDDAEWELYNVTADPTEIDDVSAQYPELTRELADAWEQAAWRNTVFPLSDASGLLNVRRPAEAALSRPVTLPAGTPALERYRSSKLIALRDVDIEVRATLAPGDAGVLVAHGDQGGGYVLFVEDGHLRLDWNAYGTLHSLDAGPASPGPAAWVLRLTALPDFRWRVSVHSGDTELAALDEVAMLVGMAPWTGISVGIDRGGPVSWPLHERHRAFPFTGRLHHVRYVPGAPANYAPGRVRAATAAATDVYE
ncbi:Arylsulfatase [Actinomadura rubteroloni]|uniref:Arylsulfatase n=1 Tax=Actinomadura rubteroloni TaxID=1926885 RepID=A0A2P4UCL2_9ACTN|nr:arylsulfatase [Actinomadura rubteroloni]POM22793.1 Arylsulfatase [Actinomadura rubteroloni]